MDCFTALCQGASLSPFAYQPRGSLNSSSMTTGRDSSCRSMKKDPAAEKAFGWILEMYAFSIASATKPGEPIQYELHPELMIQPPWDQTLQVRLVVRLGQVGLSCSRCCMKLSSTPRTDLVADSALTCSG